ncbi:hypothetical protein [Sideroxydans sp.]
MTDYNDGYEPKDVMQAHLLRMLAEAAKGDTIAAQDSIAILYGILASTEEHKLTGQPLISPLPIPNWVRHYLASALGRIMNGEDANKAFNLKRNGRRTAWSFYAKLAASDTVHYFHTHSREKKSIEESCATVAEGINRLVIRVQPQLLGSVGLGHFIGKPQMSQELVQKWYFELKEKTNFDGMQGKQIAQLMKVDLQNPP